MSWRQSRHRRFAPGLLLVGCAMALGAQPSAQSLGSGTTTWSPNGPVSALAIEGSTLYVGGAFDHVGPPTGTFAIAEATSDTSFTTTARIPGEVLRVAGDGQGGWFVAHRGPGFASDATVAHVLADGSRDGAWTSPLFDDGGPVGLLGLVLDGNRLFVAGTFVRVNGLDRRGLAALDPTNGTVLPWTAQLATDVGAGYASAMEVASGRLYLAGSFTSVGGVARNRFAVVDAATATVLPPTLPASLGNPFILGIATIESRVYLYGGCRADGFVICAYDLDLAPVPGWTFPARTPPFAATPSALFAMNSANLLQDQRVLKLDPDTGAEMPWTGPNTGPSLVRALAAAGSRLYLGGDFTSVNGQPRTRLAAVDVDTAALEAWAPLVSGPITAIGSAGASVALGGRFNSVGGIRRTNLVAIDMRSGLPLVAAAPQVDFEVRAMQRIGDALVVAGRWPFTTLATTGPNVTAFSVATGALYPWTLETNGSVDALAADARQLYLGGDFSLVGGTQRLNIAAIDLATASLTSWNPSPDRRVSTIAASEGALFAAGAFSTVPGYERRGVVAWDTASRAVLPFQPPTRDAFSPPASLGFYRNRVVFVGGRPFPPVPPDPFEWVDRSSGASVGPASDAPFSSGLAVQRGDVLYAIGTRTGSVTRSLALLDMRTGDVTLMSTNVQTVGGAPDRLAVSADYIALGVAVYTGVFPSTVELVVFPAPRGSAPRRLTAAVENTTVTLGWQAGPAPAATSFQVEAGTSVGGTDVGVFAVGTATRVTGTLPAGTYFTRVRGVGTGGAGSASSEVIVTVPSTSTPPNAPGTLSASVSAGIVTLTWGAASGNATTYVIAAGTASGLTNIGTLPTGGLDTTFSTQAPGGTYFVRVRAANAFGQSSPSNEVTIVVP